MSNADLDLIAFAVMIIAFPAFAVALFPLLERRETRKALIKARIARRLMGK